MFIPVK